MPFLWIKVTPKVKVNKVTPEVKVNRVTSKVKGHSSNKVKLILKVRTLFTDEDHEVTLKIKVTSKAIALLKVVNVTKRSRYNLRSGSSTLNLFNRWIVTANLLVSTSSHRSNSHLKSCLKRSSSHLKLDLCNGSNKVLYTFSLRVHFY